MVGSSLVSLLACALGLSVGVWELAGRGLIQALLSGHHSRRTSVERSQWLELPSPDEGAVRCMGVWGCCQVMPPRWHYFTDLALQWLGVDPGLVELKEGACILLPLSTLLPL